MNISARFGYAQTGIGYQFEDAAGTLLGSRVTAGIVAMNEVGTYLAADVTAPSGAVAVFWSTDDETAWAELEADSTDNSGDIAAIKAKTDLISAGAVTVVSPVSQEGNGIGVRAGDTLTISLADLGDLTDADQLIFAVKSRPKDADSESVLLLDLGGLQTVAGESYSSSSDGTMTVVDPAAGDITIIVKAPASEAMGRRTNAVWAVKKITAEGAAETLSFGRWDAHESLVDQPS